VNVKVGDKTHERIIALFKELRNRILVPAEVNDFFRDEPFTGTTLEREAKLILHDINPLF
jgi:hypothetical protein